MPFEKWDFIIWDVLHKVTSHWGPSESQYVTRVVINQDWVSRVGREPDLADWYEVVKKALSCG
ncbi:MAG: hypothetical protein N2Z70_06310, partial [Bdellovibrionaceae bacterium]|nr:hypothetical protein [Pseudobdellovibrionaceae bacterium]